MRILLVCMLFASAGCSEAFAKLPEKDSLELAEIVKRYVDEKKSIFDAYERLWDQSKTSTEASDKTASNLSWKELEEMEATIYKELDQSLRSNQAFAPLVNMREIVNDYVTQRKIARKAIPHDFFREEEKHEKEWDEKLVKMIESHPEFMEYPGDLLALDLSGYVSAEWQVNVKTSSDGRLRYYNWKAGRWNTKTTNVVSFRQFRTDDGQVKVSWGKNLKNKESWEWGYLVNDIFTVDIDGEKIYLLQTWYNKDPKFDTEGIHAVAIKGSDIVHPKIFKKDKGVDDVLEVDYDAQYWDDLVNEKDIDPWVVNFNDESLSIYLREINDDGKLSEDGFDDYYLNGNLYEYGASWQLTPSINE